MNFKQFLNESSIADILKEASTSGIFVMIIGGSGSGKNYWYNKNLSKIPLEDVDEYTMKWSKGDHEAGRKMVSKAIAEVNKNLTKAFENKTSIAITGTGAGLSGTVNRLNKAKEFGMKTAVILIDTDVKTAIERVNSRSEKENRSPIPEYKIERTNKEAKENFKEYKKIADYSFVVKN